MFWLNRCLYGCYKGMLIRIQWKPPSRYILDVFIRFSKNLLHSFMMPHHLLLIPNKKMIHTTQSHSLMCAEMAHFCMAAFTTGDIGMLMMPFPLADQLRVTSIFL